MPSFSGSSKTRKAADKQSVAIYGYDEQIAGEAGKPIGGRVGRGVVYNNLALSTQLTTQHVDREKGEYSPVATLIMELLNGVIHFIQKLAHLWVPFAESNKQHRKILFHWLHKTNLWQ
jgi:hypothetical protein